MPNRPTPRPSRAVPPTQIEWLPLEALSSAPRNARTHGKRQIQQIAHSIQEFGFINPIIVNQQHRIIAGHGRLEAARLLAMRKVPVLRVSHLSEAAIRAYMLADNRLPEKAGWSRELLALELQELAVLLPEIDLDVGITGFEPAEIDALLIDFGETSQDAADDLPTVDQRRRGPPGRPLLPWPTPPSGRRRASPGEL